MVPFVFRYYTKFILGFFLDFNVWHSCELSVKQYLTFLLVINFDFGLLVFAYKSQAGHVASFIVNRSKDR